MNRQSAIFRIILYSIIILLLLSILGVGLALKTFTFHFGSKTHDTHVTSQTEFQADDIHKLEIEWASGDIHIVTADTDKVSVTETGAVDDENRAVVQQTGNTLSIRFHEPAIIVGVNTISDKDLTITVPKGWTCSELSIDAASVNIETAELSIDEVEMDLASADCRFENCNFGTLDFDAASGTVYVSGTVLALDCDAASANVTAVLTNVPSHIDFDTASGDLDLTLPENAGFTVEMDTMSGGFTSEFNTTHHGARHTAGNGSCSISMDGMSGDLTIRKAK